MSDDADGSSGSALVAAGGGGEVARTLASLADEASQTIDAASSAGTRRVYASAWAAFDAWCTATGVQSLPAAPEVVCLYLTHRARSAKLSTVRVALSAINAQHRDTGLDQPGDSGLVVKFMRGLARQMGTRPEAKLPLTPEQMAAALAVTAPKSIKGIRDRAILLLGLATAARRSELTGLDVADVVEVPGGLRVVIRRSKSDQEGAGAVIGVPALPGAPDACPTAAVRTWLAASGVTSGPLFRPVVHGRVGAGRLAPCVVAEVVKAAAAATGADPAAYGGHSLRAGFATAAAQEGVEERQIMKQTRHTSERMVRRYIREGNLFRDNAADAVLRRVARAGTDQD